MEGLIDSWLVLWATLGAEINIPILSWEFLTMIIVYWPPKPNFFFGTAPVLGRPAMRCFLFFVWVCREFELKDSYNTVPKGPKYPIIRYSVLG